MDNLGYSLDTAMAAYGWGNDPARERACNNHRMVSAVHAYPSFVAANQRDYDAALFHNDAEHAEAVMGLEPGDCRWRPYTEEFYQEVPLIAEQLHPDTMGINAGEWDHNIEICALEEGCSLDDFYCINVYTIQMMTSEPPGEAGGPVDVFLRPPRQFLPHGAGDITGLRATRTTGPFPPCPVGADQRQVPCEVLKDHGAGLVRTPGFVAPEPLVFTVDRIAIDKLKHVDLQSFTLRLSYYITWSDRFAVHPCKISLYGGYGSGVPASGKTVDANDWWKPDPAKGHLEALHFRHAKNLSVLHAPDVPVISACTPESCPWPKQLYLSEKIKVELVESATWDLFRYPFDRQIVHAEFDLFDEDEFAQREAFLAATLNVTLPVPGEFDRHFERIYKPDDWRVYYAAVERYPGRPRSLVFVLKIERNAGSTIFKCLIPMFANALVVQLGATMSNTHRLQILVLSLLAAATMLNPSFLGLPENVQGIPFIQSLVIIHILLTTCVMVYALRIFITDMAYELIVLSEQKKYMGETKAVWKRHAARHNKWAELIMTDDWPGPTPTPTGPAPAAAAQKDSTGAARAAAKDSAGEVSAVAVQIQVEPDGGDELLTMVGGDASAGGTPPAASPAPVQHTVAPTTKASSANATPAATATAAASAASFDVQRAMLEVLVGLPALFHRQDPTRPPTIWGPNLTDDFKLPQPAFLPAYSKKLAVRKLNDQRLTWIVPTVFTTFWLIDIIIYFAIPPYEPTAPTYFEALDL